MKNTTENFPEVPVENLSDLSVIRHDGAVLEVVSHFIDEQFTKVTFLEGGEEKTVEFRPQAGEQLKNDSYAVVFKYGGEPFIDHNGSKN